MRRFPLNKGAECRQSYPLSLLSMLLCLVVPVVATQANATTKIKALHPLSKAPEASVGVLSISLLAQGDSGKVCPLPVLSRLTPHKVAPSETLASIAAEGRPAVEAYTRFPGYPLPSIAQVGLGYGWHQNPTTGKATFHSGIDLLANPEIPVLSVDTGTVAFAGEQSTYGNLVVVNHPGGRQTRYAHLSGVSVSVGQKVKFGDTLGTVGSTGSPDINKSHLHFEVRYYSPQGWVAQDPEPDLNAKPTAQRG